MIKDKDVPGYVNPSVLPVDNTPEEVKSPQGKQPATVPVDREQLAQILRDNEEFRLQIAQLQSNAASTQRGVTVQRNSKKEMFIKLRRWNDDYVVSLVNKSTRPNTFKFWYTEEDNNGKEGPQYVDLVLKNAKKTVKVEKSRFSSESEVVLVKVLRIIPEEDEVITQGHVFKKDFVQNGYGMFETQVQVPVEEIIKHNSYEVLLEDGDIIIVDEKFVNMQ